VNTYFINTTLHPDHKIEDDVKQAHKAYIHGNRHVIRYGGIRVAPDDSISGICYFVSFESIKTANAFIKGDPYFNIYTSFSIEEFIQRIP